MKKLLFITGIILLFSCKKEDNILDQKSYRTVYVQEAVDIFTKWDSLGYTPSDSIKDIVNNVITNLIAVNEWDNKDCFYAYFVRNKQAALVDWKHPFTRMASIENDYTGSYLYAGFKGNGANFRINTNVNLSTCTNFTASSNAFGYYSATHNTEAKTDLSSLDATSLGIELYSNGTSLSILSRNLNTTLRSTVNYTNIGFVGSYRSGGSWDITKQGYASFNGSNAFTDAAGTIPNQNVYEFCRNTNGTKAAFSSKIHSYMFIGSNCDIFKVNSIVEQYALIPLNIAPKTRIIFNGNSITANGTYIKKVMTSIGYNYDILVRGLSGKTTGQVTTDAFNTVFNKQKPYLTTEKLFFWELTNDMATNGSNVNTSYNNLLTYLSNASYYYPSAKIIVGTMLPRNSAQVNNANRQNDSNLNDTLTLNGKIRVKLPSLGYYISDMGADATVGYTGSELNTTYFQTDKLHPTVTVGHYYIADNIVTPSL